MRLPTLALRTWLLIAYGLVLALPVLVLLLSGALGQDLVRQTRWDLEHQAELLAMLVEAQTGSEPLEAHVDALNARLRQAKDATLSGIRLVDARGTVIATSGTLEALNEDLSADPLVMLALRGESQMATRPREPVRGTALDSHSRRADIRVFVVHPVRLDGVVRGALVLSRTPREETQALYQMAPAGLLQGAVLAILVTLVFAVLSSVILSRSLAAVDRGARRIADGQFAGLDDLERPKHSHLAEVGRAAHAVEKMAVRLRDRLAYIGEFASNVSHEFKTPLSTLKGTLELLQDDPDMDPLQRERFLANAIASVERLERMVSGLLSLARAEEGRLAETFDLTELVDEVARRFGAPREGVSGPVEGDRNQLDVVLTNLLANAKVHGGTATVACWSDEHTVGFTVSDDGPGISAANQAQVFERFFTTKRQEGSSGLGLALVKAIVFTHGGRVDLSSVPGDTRFRVTLPRSVPRLRA